MINTKAVQYIYITLHLQKILVDYFHTLSSLCHKSAKCFFLADKKEKEEMEGEICKETSMCYSTIGGG